MTPESQIQGYYVAASDQESDSKRGLVSRLRDLAGRVDTTLGSGLRKLQFLGHWKVSLSITIAILLAVIVARCYYSFVTGFIVPDEAWYYDWAILDRSPVGPYRTVFHAVFLFFFHGVDNVWEFLLRGTLYSAIWAVGCVLMLFAVLRRLKVPEMMSSMIVLSLPLFPVFIIFVPTILTETLGLFLALAGAYFCLRYVQEGRIANSLVSVALFVLAYKVREPYLLFVVGNILLFLVLSVKRRSLGTFAVYAALVALVFPIPVRLEPLRFVQAVTWITESARAAGYQVPVLTTSFGLPMEVTLHPDLLSAIVVGLGYGFNPLFAFFAIFSILALSFDLFRSKSSLALFLLLNAVWSFGAFVIPSELILESISGALIGWTSSLIRTTHGALPCIIGFPSLYRRLRIRRVAALTIIVIILGSTQLGSVAQAFQRSLSREPVDRLSLEYRAPYYRLYLRAKESGRTLVFGGWHMRGIRMYMAMLPNVTLVQVATQGSSLNVMAFRHLLEQNWDAIFLYDDWFTIEIPGWVDVYPQFYSEILRSRQYPGYIVETLWIDGESYALQMIKVSDSIASLPA